MVRLKYFNSAHVFKSSYYSIDLSFSCMNSVVLYIFIFVINHSLHLNKTTTEHKNLCSSLIEA